MTEPHSLKSPLTKQSLTDEYFLLFSASNAAEPEVNS